VVDIDPLMNRLVIFWSDQRVPHEVLRASKDRYHPFREHSGNIQGTFREHSANFQGTFSKNSGNIQSRPEPDSNLLHISRYTDCTCHL
jgi:hypothetical protein